MPPIRNIEQALATLGKRLQRHAAREGGALAAGALAVGVLLAVLLAQVGWQKSAIAVLFLGLLAALGGGLWHAVWRLRQGARAAQLAVAHLAEHLAPELGTAPSSAVDLVRKLDQPEAGFSRDLIEDHLERTARALAEVDLGERLQVQRQGSYRRFLLFAAGAAALAVLAALLLPQGRARLATLIFDPRAAELVDVPLAGDLRITYHYPAYTGLSARVVEGGDGTIAAVVGTEVELVATADSDVDAAVLKLEGQDGKPAQAIPMQVEKGRTLHARFPLLVDGRYHFALTTDDGDHLEERQKHPLRALPDASPKISLQAPAGDVELRDSQVVNVAYDASDDYGVAEVALVVEIEGQEPKRIRIAGGTTANKEESGTYPWTVAELGLPAGAEGRFYLEAVDNDAISGPKTSVSASRRLSLFSAQKHHDELLAQQQKVLDALVDWLDADLTAPFPKTSKDFGPHLAAQRRVVTRIAAVLDELATLVPAMAEDELGGAEISAAFGNVQEHARDAQRGRERHLRRFDTTATKSATALQLAHEQQRSIAQLEKDIIYLDDLLAVERIDTLKHTAKDLLAAQRELSEMLQEYKKTQDPALRAELEKRMQALKKQMLGLLARMAQIKQSLPGEYRNMEAASQLAVDDQLDRLEKMLREGDLDAAGRELEQLANMIENLANDIDRAEDEYGGERYAEMRQQLAEFSKQFESLESEQQALAKRAEELTQRYRQQAMQKAGGNMESFVKQAREKTAEALRRLDEVGSLEGLFGVDESLDGARQRLLDLDGLLAQKDFAEARRMVDEAEKHEEVLQLGLDAKSGRFGQPTSPEVSSAARSVNKAQQRTHEVAEMLDKLFPEPQKVMGKAGQQQMQSLGKKQAQLERKAGELAEKMAEMAGEMPLFGGEPRAALDGARGEMQGAAGDLQHGELPGGAQHGRRAAEQLQKLREALEQAGKGGKGGMPMPLGMARGGMGRDRGGPADFRPEEDVRIPGSDNKSAPRFRKELLEAAKQKAPEHYEEAVRQYYEELIR